MYETNAKAGNIITYTKVRMNPLSPQPEEISIYDIAHSLSYMCRANGHIKHFFSVAQHCINCSHEAKARGESEKVQLALLLHDASEAYIADITRPVKHNLTKYLEIEADLQSIIYVTFGIKALSPDEIKIIGEIVNVVLHHEFIHLADEKIFTEEPEIVGNYTFEFREFKDVENEYIDIFKDLTAKK